MKKFTKKIAEIIKNPLKESDDFISIAVFALLIVSLISVTSASMGFNTTASSTFRNALKQFLIICAGMAVYFIALHFYNNDFCANHADSMVIIEGALLIAAYAYCYFNGAQNGNYSWFYIAGISVQPSEFAKPVAILYIAAKLAYLNFKDKKWNEVCLIPILIIFGFVAFIALFQKDTGSALILLAVSTISFLIPSNKLYKKSQLIALGLILLALVIFIYLITPEGQEFLIKHGMESFANRFRAVTNPSYEDDGTREIFYSLLGIAKGKLTGVGIGDSVQKFGYLVSSDADYIFAIIVEETGLIGIALVFIPYILLIYRLLYYAKKASKEMDRTILVGTASYLFIHFTLNIGGVSGLLPLTGVPLLLISRGGSSTIAAMFLIGCCQAIIDQYIQGKKAAKNI